jgi:superfamily II DNA or RNA helicase
MTNHRALDSSKAEDLFIELFSEVFGLEKLQFVSPEHPVQDIYGKTRYIDFAIRTAECKIAFEIDGLQWHHPTAISVADYEDQLVRQNSLVHKDWRVFRWTDRQLADEPESVKDQLALFLEKIPNLLNFDDFLPRQKGASFSLKSHQRDALRSLSLMRSQGKTIALLTHATGTGKTTVAISDAKSMNGRTLYLAHRDRIISQTYRQFEKIWPEASVGLYTGKEKATDTFNVVGSIQSIGENLHNFSQGEFHCLIVDEAHHSTASTYRKVLGYFDSKFILGLTATPERADGQSILEIFKDSAHRLSLEEAVRLGELVPIRCMRVETNVDLSKVRYNSVNYHRKDLEVSIRIPSRDKLIVDTYQKYVPNKKAVAFTVNINHSEKLAGLFESRGVRALPVSGRLSASKREEILDDFENGKIRVLCACDVLNEGWDCPSVEVLLMARPTLSKVVYLQQMGRGVRKSPGKECLVVFDFVDNATKYNVPLSLHRIFKKSKYRKGGLVLAKDEDIEEEEGRISQNGKPTRVLNIELWEKNLTEIDIFNWQEKLKDVFSVTQLEVELAASEGLVRRAVEKGEVVPDHAINIDERRLYFFDKARTEEIRKRMGLPVVDKNTIKKLFFAFVEKMDMSSSYKPVFLKSFLNSMEDDGKAKISETAAWFKSFYLARHHDGETVEKETLRIHDIIDLSDEEVQTIMLSMPYEKFERRKYLEYHADLAYIRFNRGLWKQLNEQDKSDLLKMCEESIKLYFEKRF